MKTITLMRARRLALRGLLRAERRRQKERTMAALDKMGLEYVFTFSGVGGTCCFCGKGECDFSVSGKSFHAECVAAKD